MALLLHGNFSYNYGVQLYYLVRLTSVHVSFSSASKSPLDQDRGLTLKQKTALQRKKSNVIAKVLNA